MNCDSIYCWLTLLGPAAIVFAAVFAKRYHASISAKRATVDFMVAEEANLPLATARKVFAQSGSKGPKHLTALLNAISSDNAADEQWREYGEITMYLNHCELVAVAINSGALDEEMYMKCYRSSYVQAWDRSKELVNKARTSKSQTTMYEHFEEQAKKWSN